MKENCLFRGHRKCIDSVWYGNTSNQDCKALQRVVRLAERISGSALPSLQDIYLKRCKSRAVKIIKDSNHPGNRLFILLPSGKRFRKKNWETEELQAPLHHPYCCYVYYIPCKTSLHILLAHSCFYYYLLSLQYTVLHILLYCTFYCFTFYLYFFHTYIYVFSFVLNIIALSMEQTWLTFHCWLYSV